MSHKITNRQKTIVNQFTYEKEYKIGDIQLFHDLENISLATLKRDLSILTKSEYILLSGESRSSSYGLSSKGLIHRDIQNSPVYQNTTINSYNFDLFSILEKENLFTDDEFGLLNDATEIFKENSKNATDTIFKKELERFIIELSWKSSKIEGNTYTLLNTERLIREGIVSKENTENETIMILNHKKSFSYILEHEDILSFRELENIHRLLVEDLGINHGIRKAGVGITGTRYIPLGIRASIEEETRRMIDVIKSKEDYFSRALIAVLCISYLQSFEDGNKRTARIFANGILVKGGLAPLSYRDIDEAKYREAMLVFYEQNSIEAFKKIFVEQYVFSCHTYNIAGALR